MDVLLGLQWGDEGKGKIVDVLAPQYDTVARFQGGPNAGHTLFFDGVKHVLHQIPSGIFHSSIQNVIGNGVVLDLVILQQEIEKLQAREVDARANLFISQKAQLILPTHRLLDAAQEQAKGDAKIGSTLKGISPTYQDKIGREGLRMGDILSDDFKSKYEKLKQKHLKILAFYSFEYDLEAQETAFFEAVDFFRNYKIIDTFYQLHNSRKANQSILAEGAQGTLLDVDFGSYPFVTSSNTSAAGACTGLGIAPNQVQNVFGIFKAYCTRVGSGPFPTELFDQVGKKMQDIGGEFGATTGRPRRCGWLDLPALNYAVMLNGVTELFMMKADVLADFDEVKVCTHYQLPDGSTTQEFPYQADTKGITPIYKSFKGWGEISAGIESFDDLPQNLLDYIAFIEKETGIPVNLVSYGPDRTATLKR